MRFVIINTLESAKKIEKRDRLVGIFSDLSFNFVFVVDDGMIQNSRKS